MVGSRGWTVHIVSEQPGEEQGPLELLAVSYHNEVAYQICLGFDVNMVETKASFLSSLVQEYFV